MLQNGSEDGGHGGMAIEKLFQTCMPMCSSFSVLACRQRTVLIVGCCELGRPLERKLAF